MPKVVPLDKILVQGTTVTLDDREAWIIRKLGTNATTPGRLKIDGKPTGDLIDLVAPLHVTSSNLLGPLDLAELYYVVPEETKVEWEGPTGSKARVIGQKLIFNTGEKLGEPYLSRYRAQYDQFWTFVQGTFTKGVDTPWPAGEENTVISLTPKTIEKYILDSVVEAKIMNVSGGVAEGDWAFRFYIDNNPLENLIGANEKVGIDVLSAPEPPSDTTEMIPFTLKDFPIEVLGDRNLMVKVVNTSGTEKTPISGTSITARITFLTRFYRPVL